jgi:hypothetical protein
MLVGKGNRGSYFFYLYHDIIIISNRTSILKTWSIFIGNIVQEQIICVIITVLYISPEVSFTTIFT